MTEVNPRTPDKIYELAFSRGDGMPEFVFILADNIDVDPVYLYFLYTRDGETRPSTVKAIPHSRVLDYSEIDLESLFVKFKLEEVALAHGDAGKFQVPSGN